MTPEESAANSWRAMMHRCFEESGKSWHRYGGRGITVCLRWRGQDGLSNFIADTGPKPPATTIDRKDNDGNYSCGKCPECVANGWPENCRWATVLEQARNRAARNTWKPRRKSQVHVGTRKWSEVQLSKMSPDSIVESKKAARAEVLTMSLREIRNASGKTQEELAKLIDLSQAQLSRLESLAGDVQDRKLRSLRRYVEALGGKVQFVAVFGNRRVRIAGL